MNKKYKAGKNLQKFSHVPQNNKSLSSQSVQDFVVFFFCNCCGQKCSILLWIFFSKFACRDFRAFMRETIWIGAIEQNYLLVNATSRSTDVNQRGALAECALWGCHMTRLDPNLRKICRRPENPRASPNTTEFTSAIAKSWRDRILSDSPAVYLMWNTQEVI